MNDDIERMRGNTPRWGRAALGVLIGGIVIVYVGVATNTLPDATWAPTLLVVMAAAITLSIVSLLRRERRGFALTTLVLTLALPLAIVVGFLVFFTYFY